MHYKIDKSADGDRDTDTFTYNDKDNYFKSDNFEDFFTWTDDPNSPYNLVYYGMYNGYDKDENNNDDFTIPTTDDGEFDLLFHNKTQREHLLFFGMWLSMNAAQRSQDLNTKSI